MIYDTGTNFLKTVSVFSCKDTFVILSHHEQHQKYIQTSVER